MKSSPYLRMFAGPNGSGKSTMKNNLPSPLLGVYINPDEIEAIINRTKIFNFGLYRISFKFKKLTDFIASHPLAVKFDLEKTLKLMEQFAAEGIVKFNFIKINPYLISILSDFIRHELLEKQLSFSFETVMSSPDKIEFLKKAKANGFRIHLYFVATEDPIINVARVRDRVAKGGHNVPEDKIISRYYRTLEMLSDAVKTSNKVQIYDNTGREIRHILTITNGKKIKIESSPIPSWVNKYLLKI